MRHVLIIGSIGKPQIETVFGDRIGASRGLNKKLLSISVLSIAPSNNINANFMIPVFCLKKQHNCRYDPKWTHQEPRTQVLGINHSSRCINHFCALDQKLKDSVVAISSWSGNNTHTSLASNLLPLTVLKEHPWSIPLCLKQRWYLWKINWFQGHTHLPWHREYGLDDRACHW